MPPRRRIPVKKLPPPEVENSTKKSPPKKSKSLNESNIFREQKWAYQLRLKSLCLSNDWFDFEMALEVSSLLLSLDIQFLHWSDYFRHAVILERVRTETSVLAFLNWALLSPLVRHDVRGNVEISTFTKRISRKIESYQDETPSDYSNFDKPRFERSLLSLQNRRVNTDMFPPGWIPVISEKSIASIISQARLYGIPTDTLRDSLLNSDEKIAESVTIFHQLGDLEINHRKVIAIARDHLVMGRNQACMDVLKSIPSHCQELSDFISLRICVLFQVKNKTELFSLSHSLFRDHHQNDPFPWMAAGLYYLLSERLDEARQFLL